MDAKKVVLRLLRFFWFSKRTLKNRLVALAWAVFFAVLSGVHAFFGLSFLPLLSATLGFFIGWILLSYWLAVFLAIAGYIVATIVSFLK